MMRNVIIIGLIMGLSFGLSACGGSGEPGGKAGDGSSSAQNQRVATTTRLSGTLYLNYNAPLESPRLIAVNLSKKNFKTASTGIHGSVVGDEIAIAEFCSPLAMRLSLVDNDGFTTGLSDCYELDIVSGTLQNIALSPDGKFVAVLNHKLKRPQREDDPYNIDNFIGANEYSGVQIFSREGELVQTFDHYGPAAWTRDNRLIIAGRGEDSGFGIFMADKKLKSLKRIDDGRLSNAVGAIDTHPRQDMAAFIANGQLYEVNLSSGKIKRLHQHGFPLAGLAYSPNGRQIALISIDNLEEASQSAGYGYPVFVYDDGKIERIDLPFVGAASLDWTE